MRFFSITIFLVLIGSVFGDLSCSTYLPHNWTTRYARFNVYDTGDDGEGAKPVYTIPANASATNPFSVAKKSAPGDTFYMKICQSKSLNLNSSFYMSPSYCDASKKARSTLKARDKQNGCTYLCNYSWNYFIQIIHNGTGNCLTTQSTHTETSEFYFKPCNPDPKDTTQIFGANRVEYYDNSYGYPVCDWAPQINVGLVPNSTRYNFPSWDVAPDNKTLIRNGNTPRAIQVNGLAIDPLTDYTQKSN